MELRNTSVLEFMNSVQSKSRKKDGFVIIEMMCKITNLEPQIWGPSIIGFGSYVHHYSSGRETKLPLVSFSPRKQHLVLYVLNGFENQEKMLNGLGKHKKGNICLYINKLADVNLKILEKIIASAYNKNTRYSK